MGIFLVDRSSLETKLLNQMVSLLTPREDAYDDLFTQKDPIKWAEKYFYIPELNGPIQLASYQKRAIREIIDPTFDYYPYTMILWCDIKKSIKSCIAAMLGLHMAFTRPWASVKYIANDQKQSRSRSFFYLTRAIEMNPILGKFADIKMYDVIIAENHSHVEAVPVDPKGEAGGNDDAVFYSELWGAKNESSKKMWCYDDKTEILTRNRGWIKGIDLVMSDIVAAFDPIKDTIVWESPRSIFNQNYEGEMHLYESNTFSECVTPDHRLYGKFSYGGKNGNVISGKRYNYTIEGVMRSNELRASGYNVYHAKDAFFGWTGSNPEYKVFKASKNKPELHIAWSDWCDFMGWFISEGSIKCNRGIPYSVRVCQSPTANPEKWKILKDCMDRCFCEYGYTIKDNKTSFYVSSVNIAKELYAQGKSNEKYIPEEIRESTQANLRKFLSSYLLGDGTKGCGKNSMVGLTTSRRLANDLSEVGLKLGHGVTITKHEFDDYRLTGYRVLFYKSDGYCKWLQRGKHWKTINYNGSVWCPSVSTGLVVVRRNDKIYVSGNTESTLSPTKYGKSFRFVETYAGFVGESPILEDLYEHGVKNGDQVSWADEFDPPLEAYTNKSAGMFTLWNTTPRLSFQTEEYYAQEAAVLSENEFDRVHRNQWVSSTGSFVQPEWWDACKPEASIADTDDDASIVVMDAAISGDCFGVIRVIRRDGKTIPVDVRKWTPPKGGKIMYEPPPGADPNDTEYPAGYVRYLVEKHNVLEVAYDPYQLHSLATSLAQELVCYFRPFNQVGERLLADKELQDAIKAREIVNLGDADLTEHVLNAAAKSEGDKSIRIVKKSDARKIDLCVCLSMGHHEAVRLNI